MTTLFLACNNQISHQCRKHFFSTQTIVSLTVALSCPGQPWTAPLAILSVVGFVGAFGIGMGPVPWLLPAELFPADRVATGSALAAMCNWLANFVCGLLFLPLAAALGGLCFVPFFAVLVPFACFVASIPETRGKSVQQILDELAGEGPFKVPASEYIGVSVPPTQNRRRSM